MMISIAAKKSLNTAMNLRYENSSERSKNLSTKNQRVNENNSESRKELNTSNSSHKNLNFTRAKTYKQIQKKLLKNSYDFNRIKINTSNASSKLSSDVIHESGNAVCIKSGVLTELQHQKIISNLTMKHKFQIYREKLNQLRYSHRRDSNLQPNNLERQRDKYNLTEYSECEKSQKSCNRKQRKELSSNSDTKNGKEQLKILSVGQKRNNHCSSKNLNSQITENDHEE